MTLIIVLRHLGCPQHRADTERERPQQRVQLDTALACYLHRHGDEDEDDEAASSLQESDDSDGYTINPDFPFSLLGDLCLAVLLLLSVLAIILPPYPAAGHRPLLVVHLASLL